MMKHCKIVHRGWDYHCVTCVNAFRSMHRPAEVAQPANAWKDQRSDQRSLACEVLAFRPFKIYDKQRRISYPTNPTSPDPFVADKGHFVVYTTDKKRFMFPLEYLNRNVFRELLKMSEEEFGHQIHGAFTLPCDSTLLEYVILLVRLRIAEELEKTLLTSIAACHQLASSSLS
ncbi:Auxin-responsive protein [Melia azedarach]|uniref:Auxin-responsive protein n=1 Tax=Melia azedarach TaxID=155640 RepID=A0ACC1XYB8_MELAZ|nr:Auxin-responsive protein [Melia azedarach]